MYNWTETEVKYNNSLTCFYKNQNAPNSTATVVRVCDGHRVWSPYIPGDCISETTFEFQSISQVYIIICATFGFPNNCIQVQLTAENLEMIIGQLANVVSVATDVQDQVSDNVGIISAVLSTTTTVAASGNFSIDISVRAFCMLLIFV